MTNFWLTVWYQNLFFWSRIFYNKTIEIKIYWQKSKHGCTQPYLFVWCVNVTHTDFLTAFFKSFVELKQLKNCFLRFSVMSTSLSFLPPDYSNYVGWYQKCPPSFWGEKHNKVIAGNSTLSQFKWVEFKNYKPAKAVKKKKIAACCVFDCENEVNNFVPCTEVKESDCVPTNPGNSYFILCIFMYYCLFLISVFIFTARVVHTQIPTQKISPCSNLLGKK